MREVDNLSGQEFGIWKVIKFEYVQYYGANHRHGMSYYTCQCKKCGAIRLVPRSRLTHSPNLYHQDCEKIV